MLCALRVLLVLLTLSRASASLLIADVLSFLGGAFGIWRQGDGGFLEWVWECALPFSPLGALEKDWH